MSRQKKSEIQIVIHYNGKVSKWYLSLELLYNWRVISSCYIDKLVYGNPLTYWSSIEVQVQTQTPSQVC